MCAHTPTHANFTGMWPVQLQRVPCSEGSHACFTILRSPSWILNCFVREVQWDKETQAENGKYVCSLFLPLHLHTESTLPREHRIPMDPWCKGVQRQGKCLYLLPSEQGPPQPQEAMLLNQTRTCFKWERRQWCFKKQKGPWNPIVSLLVSVTSLH